MAYDNRMFLNLVNYVSNLLKPKKIGYNLSHPLFDSNYVAGTGIPSYRSMNKQPEYMVTSTGIVKSLGNYWPGEVVEYNPKDSAPPELYPSKQKKTKKLHDCKYCGATSQKDICKYCGGILI